jgi:hypothetical protein
VKPAGINIYKISDITINESIYKISYSSAEYKGEVKSVSLFPDHEIGYNRNGDYGYDYKGDIPDTPKKPKGSPFISYMYEL